MNDPVAWINRKGEHGYLEWDKDDSAEINTPLYTQEALEEARKLGMQQERALWNLSASTQEIEALKKKIISLEFLARKEK